MGTCSALLSVLVIIHLALNPDAESLNILITCFAILFTMVDVCADNYDNIPE